jgi:hypothetical protein
MKRENRVIFLKDIQTPCPSKRTWTIPCRNNATFSGLTVAPQIVHNEKKN